jgi:spermidine/putrescine transport system ATP-binding protein
LIRTTLGSFVAPHGATHIAIRPEHVRLGGSIAAKVTDVVYQGSFKRVTAALSSQQEISILAKLPADALVKIGDEVDLGVDAAHVITLKD